MRLLTIPGKLFHAQAFDNLSNGNRIRIGIGTGSGEWIGMEEAIVIRDWFNGWIANEQEKQEAATDD